MTKNKSDTRGKRPDTFCTAVRSPVRSEKYWAIRLWDAGNNEDINMVAGQRARLQCYSRPRSKCKLRIFRNLTRVALLFCSVGYLCLKHLRMIILYRYLNQICDCCGWRKYLNPIAEKTISRCFDDWFSRVSISTMSLNLWLQMVFVMTYAIL